MEMVDLDVDLLIWRVLRFFSIVGLQEFVVNFPIFMYRKRVLLNGFSKLGNLMDHSQHNLIGLTNCFSVAFNCLLYYTSKYSSSLRHRD